MYVQTFLTAYKSHPILLLPLLEQKTKVTHVILASLHLHEQPRVMRLNDDALDSPLHTVIWEEVGILQENGIKVMALLGGAAAGSYKRLNGTESDVRSPLQRLLGVTTAVLLLLPPPPPLNPIIQPRRARHRYRRNRGHQGASPSHQRPAPRSRPRFPHNNDAYRLSARLRNRAEPLRLLVI